MKTRIISGAVLVLVTAAVITAGNLINPLIITFFIALIAAVAVYELLRNAAKIENRAAVAGGCVYAFLAVFTLDKSIASISAKASVQALAAAAALSVIYFIFAAVTILAKHELFDLVRIFAFAAMPLPVAFAFSTLGFVLNHGNGLFYLLLLLNFSSICDMGAYFAGVTLGKHKLCPSISPNKTVEGAVGGVLLSLAVSVALTFAFSQTAHVAALLLLTVPFCILGMVGDLFASAIKRSAGIKDYGKLIPGHGGILDRFDSIIMIAPLFYIFISAGVI